MTNNKTLLLRIWFFGLVTCLLLPNHVGLADDFLPEKFTPEQTLEYERQLNAILKTTRDEEKKFVGEVVLKIRDGKLPSRLVNTSYQWVMQKRPGTNYRFIYFVKVLELQAKALKLDSEVPTFDFSIYSSAGQRTGSKILSAGQKAKQRFGFLNRFRLIR